MPQDFQHQVLDMLRRLNIRLDSFNDRFIVIEGELGRIRRCWNIPILDAELEKEKELEDDEDDVGGED